MARADISLVHERLIDAGEATPTGDCTVGLIGDLRANARNALTASVRPMGSPSRSSGCNTYVVRIDHAKHS